MQTKLWHLDHSDRRAREREKRRQSDLVWPTQILLILATLALLAVAYGVWHVLHVEAPFREVPPDTLLPIPGPVP
jgi:Flp pilus assembly protein TadB